ncbi:hypothetical protein HPB50_010467 [Hyalomma asiaticum]|uniref:Uncharacterized protein n=1 Tax=Hyalomma asiaticum TaxID=266040 RepID=A0ACB7SUZ4_HYAAI|nr:hypothetical protein HPB50_010467 [Hyalomma asiaticum]
MDVVHLKYVSSEDYMSECAWIRQAVSEDSVCLPMAKNEIEGPFSTLKTVAAVSKGLPEEYPYLFSNKSESLLNKQGKSFTDVEPQNWEIRKEEDDDVGRAAIAVCSVWAVGLGPYAGQSDHMGAIRPHG